MENLYKFYVSKDPKNRHCTKNEVFPNGKLHYLCSESESFLLYSQLKKSPSNSTMKYLGIIQSVRKIPRKTNRSNINEDIKAVLFFKRKDFTPTKSTKRKQATFTQTFLRA